MTQFDPWCSWLGIPLHEQPPTYYRLLGIPLFESNPDVISQAAARQMFHVQTFQAGPYAEACQQVLGQLAYAQACLLDPQQKTFYDQQLAEALGHRTERQVAAPPPPPGSFNPTVGHPGTMPGAYGSPPTSPPPATMAAPGAYGSPPPTTMAAPGVYGSPPPATMAAPGAYAHAGYAAAWGQATQYPVPPAPAPTPHGFGPMGSTVPAAMSAPVPLAASVAVPMATAVAAPPAVAQPRPGSPPVVGGKGPTPPPPPVQTQDEEAALAAMMQDERVPRRSLRRKPSAKPKGLSKEMISLCAAGAVIALIALVWLASNAMSRQKHGWDTYVQEPTAASPNKKKAGAERADKTVRDSGKKHEEGKFAVRPRPGVARPPWGAPAVGARPGRPPAAVEDQGEAIAAPVTKSFPPATHNPLGDFGPGAQLPPGTEPAQPAPAPEATNLPPLPEEPVDGPPDREIGPRK